MNRVAQARTWQAGAGRMCRAGLGLLALLALGACAAGPFPAATPPPTEQAEQAAETPAAPAEANARDPEPQAPAGESADQIDPTGATPAQLVALPAELVIEPPIEDDPKTLMGLDRGGLAELLGKPSQVRRESPAEIWQYVGSDCIFDIFLYKEQGAYRVIHAEARDDEVALKTEARACLNQLLRARLEDPLS